MNSNGRLKPPTAEDIERGFRTPTVVITRQLILGGIGALSTARSFGWRAFGLDDVLATPRPFILAANHQSHADTAAILGTLPRPIRERTAVAAALDVFGNGSAPSLKRRYLQLFTTAGFHAFAFDRHGPPLRSLRIARQLLGNGWNLLLYPEGTRSRTGELGPFKAGVSVLARFSRRPLIPVHVEGGRQVLPCGAFLPRAGRITVRYGRPLFYERGDTLDGFAARVREHVAGAAAD
jgi:1-acyl-sn-glycerol-3-phosphate acyltransferase